MSTTKIAHLADIHVRKFKRHDEYRKVFKNLYKSLEKDKVDRIVLAGDIVHNKNDLSPELVQLISEFFVELSNISPLDIIIGNHDKIIGQDLKLDSLSPITDYLNIKNLTLFKNSGIFEIDDNLVYGIFAIDDEENFPYNIKNKDSSKTYVALFHGAIAGSRTDVNYVIKSNHEINMFSEYDIAMLGDIHKFQDISSKSTKICYSSSLVQQNHGESLENHGYLLWNVPNKTYKFVKVKNDFGFYTLRFANADEIDKFYTHLPSDIPKYPQIRVLLNKGKDDIVDVKNLSKFIKDKFNPASLVIESELEDDEENKVQIKHISNVSEFGIQQDILKNYLTAKNHSSDEIEKILFQHKIVYNKLVNYEFNMYRSLNWTIHKMNFSNTFSYGKNHVINFDNLKGLVGVFSGNATGKSSIIYTLLNGLFNESNRASRNNICDVINNNEKEAAVDIEFSLDKRKFLLKRTVVKNEKNSNRARNNVKLYEYNGDSLEDLSGDANINNTEKLIRSLIGEYDEHSMACFGQQNDLFNFIEMNQGSRKDRLSSFLGLKIFEELYKICREENNEIRTLLKQYKNNDYDGTYFELDGKLTDVNSQIKELDISKNDLEKELEESNTRLLSLSNSLTKIEDELDIDELDSQTLLTEKRIFTLKKEITKYQEILEKIKGDIVFVNESILATTDEELSKLEKSTELCDKIKKEIDNLSSKKKLLEKDLQIHSKMANTLELHDWFEDSDVCKKCTFLLDAFKSRDQLQEIETKISQIDVLIEKRKEQQKVLEEYTKKFQEYQKLRRDLEKLENNKEKCLLKLELLEKDLKSTENTSESLKKSIEKYEQSKNDIQLNDAIRKEMNELQKDIKYCKERLENVIRQLYSQNGEKGSIEQKMFDIKELVNKIYELNEKNKVYEILQSCLHKDGIPSSIIKTIIPHINTEIRNVLSNIVNFDISLEIDDESGDLMIYINDTSKRKITLGSGMEKTITSIAIRAALTNVSLLPKSSVFVIDEGFSALDAENLNSINLLLGYLKDKFKTVFIVSHIDWMTDIMDHTINIEKNNKNYSKISID